MTILKNWAHWLSCLQTLQSHSLCPVHPLPWGWGRRSRPASLAPADGPKASTGVEGGAGSPLLLTTTFPQYLLQPIKAIFWTVLQWQFLGHCDSAPSVLSERLPINCCAPDLGWDTGAVKKSLSSELWDWARHMWQSVFIRLPWLVAIVWNAFIFFFKCLSTVGRGKVRG